MYQERMLSYYPQAIQMISEFQAIVGAEAPEFESLNEGKERITTDAYLLTMGEERIAQWEQFLGIRPIARSTISDRRDVVVARVRAQSKLNTLTINSIVNAFTGGTARSWFKDSTVYVEITPPPENKAFKFDNVTNELRLKIPAHLNLNVSRSYQIWEDVDNNNPYGWKEVRACYRDWFDVLYNAKQKPNELDVTTFEKFYLG